MILVYLGRWSYGRFKDDNNILYKMKNDLNTGTWQDDIWCPIIIILLCTSDESYTIHSGITQPHQFSLRNMPTMSSITDSVGEGWDKRKIWRYFNERNNIANQQDEVSMTTSKQFEQAYIIFSMTKKLNWQQRKGKESYTPLNVICPPLKLKMNQFARNMLQCSKMISSHSTLRKICYFPCHIGLFYNLVANILHWITHGTGICFIFLSKIELNQTNQAREAIKDELR
jgi:hypothetical protein